MVPRPRPCLTLSEHAALMSPRHATQRLSRTPRRFDEPILRWVGYHGFVTVQQVVHRFWIQRGVGGQYGYRCVAKLVAEGALRQRLLDLGGDNSTPRIVYLTPDGYRKLGVPVNRPYSGADLEAHIRYKIQGAEVMLEREPEGWTVIPKTQEEAVVRAVRDFALGRFRGRALDSYAAHMRTRIERLSPKNFSLPMSVFWHPQLKEVRLLLPVRPGVSYKRHLEKVSGVGFMKHVDFEAVCSVPDLLSGAKRAVQRWAGRNKVEAHVHCVPHFRTRPNPIGT